VPDLFANTPECRSARTVQRWSGTERSVRATEQSVNTTDHPVVVTERSQCVPEQRVVAPKRGGSLAAQKHFAPERATTRTIDATAELGRPGGLTKHADGWAEYAHRRSVWRG
jgi:hypothetical protein